MKKKIKRIIITIVILFVLILIGFLGAILYRVHQEINQEEELRTEIADYYNRDLLKDDFSIKMKTKGDCAYVEQAVKKFYKDLSDHVKKIFSDLKDEKFSNIFNIENLTSDRPDFIKSHMIVKKTRDKVKQTIQNIDQLCEEETIKNLLDREKLSDDKYYYDFYLELIYTKEDREKFKEVKENMNQIGKKVNIYFDKIDQMLNFLQENDEAILYKEILLFKDPSLLIEWKKQLSELQEIIGTDTNLSNTITA